MRVVFTPEAAAQADHCDSWWRQHRPSAPGLFARELVEAAGLVAQAPGIGPVHRTIDGHPVRRLLLKKTRNHVYYVVEADRIVVHSVWGAVKGRGPAR